MKATCVLSVALLGAGVRLELAGAGVHHLPQLPESAQLAHDHPRVLHHNKLREVPLGALFTALLLCVETAHCPADPGDATTVPQADAIPRPGVSLAVQGEYRSLEISKLEGFF